MHANYDELGEKDGFVSYEEIKRALGATTEEDWKKEIEPFDDGDNKLDPTGLTTDLNYWIKLLSCIIEANGGHIGLSHINLHWYY